MKIVRIYKPRGTNRCSIEGCQEKYYGSSFCKKHHQWHWKRGLLPTPDTMTVADKLKGRIEIDNVGGCWLWARGRNSKGYGIVAISGVRTFAHRASYETFVGKIPNGLEVCHHCDVPRCINPEHLFLGTHYENMLDSVRKGRTRAPKAEKGFSHPRSIFTPDIVAHIRKSSLDAKALARELGCHPETVRRARREMTYQ